MRSFGLWYKNNGESNSMPVFSVHINFWSESVKKDIGTPDLDVGIKIRNFRSVNELIFHCPFVIEESAVKDLAPKLCKLEECGKYFPYISSSFGCFLFLIGFILGKVK